MEEPIFTLKIVQQNIMHLHSSRFHDSRAINQRHLVCSLSLKQLRAIVIMLSPLNEKKSFPE